MSEPLNGALGSFTGLPIVETANLPADAVEWWEAWSNDLAALLPERYDGEGAQEAVIEDAVRDLVAKVVAAEQLAEEFLTIRDRVRTERSRTPHDPRTAGRCAAYEDAARRLRNVLGVTR